VREHRERDARGWSDVGFVEGGQAAADDLELGRRRSGCDAERKPVH
jgi:hypothetical protein